MRAKKSDKSGEFTAKVGFPALILICASLFMSGFTAFSAPPYPLAIACVTNINLNGNNIRVDSFDSSNPNYSIWNTNLGYGTYDPAIARANGNVGTDSSITGANFVGQANIYGHLDIGPDGSSTIGNYGYVGPLPQVGQGIQTGYSNNDMNVVFPDAVLPLGANNWPAFSGSTISASGNYYMSSINSSLSINAPYVTIFVNGDISLSGNSSITISTNVTHVTIYVVGPVADFEGNGLINLTQRASVLSIYGLPTLTSIAIGGNDPVFTGIIYAPEADLYFAIDGNDVNDLFGAVVVNYLQLDSHANFHFDESLAPGMPLWIAMQPTNHAVQPGSNTTFIVSIGGGYALGYQWYFNQTNQLSGATNCTLSLTNVQFSNAGAYSVVATNFAGSVTSAPASLIVYTNASASLNAPTILTNGLQFTVTGVAGLNYIVQSSTNLSTWISLATNQPPFIFSDTNSSGSPQQFYRAACFPP